MSSSRYPLNLSLDADSTFSPFDALVVRKRLALNSKNMSISPVKSYIQDAMPSVKARKLGTLFVRLVG